MSRIADYELGESLGRGNHGRYYKAAPPARLGLDADVVAVKVLDQHAGDDEYRRFANELKLFASVRSPHLVRLYDAGHQDGILFYALEYFPLGSLASPARELAPGDVLRAVAGAARGAHALHEVGVAHRDIKPANVMLIEDGGKLSDLGLAQVLNPGQTVTGFGPIGAIEYMEPGVVRGDPASRASDIWALGATLHKALAGTSVFGDIPTDDVLSALRHVLNTSPRVSPDLDDAARALIESCVAPAPEDRPATAMELAERLEVLAT